MYIYIYIYMCIYMCIYIQKHTYMTYIHNIEVDKYICLPIFTLLAYINMYMHRFIYINVLFRRKCSYLGLF